MNVKLPDKVPGVVELKGMCSAAARVHELCKLLGFEFRGAPHLEAQLEELLEEGHTALEVADGGWIFPEEVE